MKRGDNVAEELVLRLMRDRSDIRTDSEEGAALFSTWQLAGKYRSRLRVGTEPEFEVCVRQDGVRFSAHSHPGEPLSASCEDVAWYMNEGGSRTVFHYITDGYLCVRVK